MDNFWEVDSRCLATSPMLTTASLLGGRVPRGVTLPPQGTDGSVATLPTKSLQRNQLELARSAQRMAVCPDYQLLQYQRRHRTNGRARTRVQTESCKGAKAHVKLFRKINVCDANGGQMESHLHLLNVCFCSSKQILLLFIIISSLSALPFGSFFVVLFSALKVHLG